MVEGSPAPRRRRRETMKPIAARSASINAYVSGSGIGAVTPPPELTTKKPSGPPVEPARLADRPTRLPPKSLQKAAACAAAACVASSAKKMPEFSSRAVDRQRQIVQRDALRPVIAGLGGVEDDAQIAGRRDVR